MPLRGRHRFNKKGKHDKFPESSKRFQTQFKPKNKYAHFMSHERLSESEVGITEYLSNLDGFSAVIKARYSDFHVNEIDKSGVVAKLSDLSVPKDFNSQTTEVNVSDEYPEELTVMSKETWERIRGLLISAEEDVVKIDANSINREDRTKIHMSVKAAFGRQITADTVTIDGVKFMTFKKHSKTAQQDTRFQWPKDKGEYVHFLVYKEAVDTSEASLKISDSLKMKSSMLTYAGVKDKRAKSTQWFCVKKVNPQRLIEKTKYLRNIHIGNIVFKNEPLKLGQLQGNRFRIALRNVKAEDDLINKAMCSLQTTGFINYYGLQRFGNDKEVPTYDIGIKLLQGKWKEACDLILKPKKCEDLSTEIAQAKRIYQNTLNSELASKKFGKFYNKCIESKLLIGFSKNHPHDYVTSLENIPRNMRLLYIHSFQSLIWNKIVSRRIKQFGLKPIKGDIVSLDQNCEKNNYIPQNIEDDDDGEEDNVEVEEPSQEVKILTEDDLNNYTVFDIVLPLPGYDVKYPENVIKDWYIEMLGEYGLTLEVSTQKVKTYTLSGTYRKMLQQAKNLSWETVRYDHPNDILIRSDYELLIGATEPEHNSEGQYKALIMDFCLESSCYATMLLREILKIDTSTSSQAKLNTYHEDNKIESSDVSKPAEVESLLSNSKEYEEFKRLVFEVPSEPLKRKQEEIEENAKNKILKSEEDIEDTTVKSDTP